MPQQVSIFLRPTFAKLMVVLQITQLKFKT